MKHPSMIRSSVMALGVLLAVGCGKDNGAGNNPINPGPAGAEITTYDQIASTADRRSLVNKTVALDSVPVARVVGTYTFWIGTLGNAIPVVRQDRINGPVTSHVKAGHHAKLVGTIRLASAVEATNPMWRSINASEKRDIENAQVFILADTVDPQP